MLTKEEFELSINLAADHAPKQWRRGQAIFNITDEMYGIARIVQYESGIDCFYNDSKIKEFIDAAYDVYCNIINSQR